MKVLSTDFNEIYDDIIEEIGIDNFIKLCKLRGGMSVYIPKYPCVIRLARNREIVKRFNQEENPRLKTAYNLRIIKATNYLNDIKNI